jgi:succinyl-diaminopimelate desuccinylase
LKESLSFLQSLVATPSQVGVDDLSKILSVVSRWLKYNHIDHILIGPPKKPVAVVINPPQDGDEEVLLLNACLDTAPVGDLAQWKMPAFAGEVHDGWLYGRGSADSKAAVAIFCEISKTTKINTSDRNPQRRRVTVVFDCDEHSGRFGGIRAYTREYGFPTYCAIGYPGLDEIVSGSRGFYRTNISLRGVLAHAGSGTVPKELATTKLMLLLRELSALTDTPNLSPDFRLGPRASVTWIKTGIKSYSVTPSKIECGIDIRLTPSFDPNAASDYIDSVLKKIAKAAGSEYPSTISKPNCWPAYKTPDSALLPRLLTAAAEHELGSAPPLSTSGPSNIGNFLSMHGSQVLSGFGVNYKRIHGPDECVEVKTMEVVRKIYARAIQNFLSPPRTDA